MKNQVGSFHHPPKFLPAIILGFLVLLSPSMTTPVTAQSSNPPAAAEDELALRQSDIADRYADLEKLILRMAEFDSSENPRRAELLKQAFALSKDRHVAVQLDTLVELLNQRKLGRALSNQKDVGGDLTAMLELLLSENRADRLKDEQARIRGYIKEIERIERMQRSVQGRTEGGIDSEQAAKEQQRVADRTDDLNKEIAKNEESPNEEKMDGGESKDGESKDGESKDGEPKDGESKDGESKDGESKDGESKDGEPKDGESKDGESKDGESKDGESKDGESKDGESKDGEPKDGEPKDGEPKDGESKDGEPKDGEPSDGEAKDGKPSQGKPSQGKPSDGGESSDSESTEDEQQPPEEFPGKNRLQEAQEKMKDAEDKLKQANRDEAVEDQEDAARKLAEAKAELEEILRQLREEEIERVLAMLESRFREMLEMELQVYEGTMRLAKLPAERRDQFVDIESGKLSFQQRRVVVDCEKCLALLREEGSSVAFPESVMQMRDDMKDVEGRLSKAQIGRLTQSIEEDIIEALDEMIAALQQAQKDQEERKKQQQQQQQQQMSDEDQALVDQIAELRMLKALQLRVNKKTNRYARLLDDVEDVAGQATDDELVAALHELAERELRLQQITHDIVVGKNK